MIIGQKVQGKISYIGTNGVNCTINNEEVAIFWSDFIQPVDKSFYNTGDTICGIVTQLNPIVLTSVQKESQNITDGTAKNIFGYGFGNINRVHDYGAIGSNIATEYYQTGSDTSNIGIMDLEIKISKAKHLLEQEKTQELDIINAIDDGQKHLVKLSTNSFSKEMDKKNPYKIAAIKGVKIVYKMQSGGCVILMGNLGCSFRQPFGGEFYVTKATIQEGVNFESITGVSVNLQFTNYPMSIESMQSTLEIIAQDENFVFNLSQFDEFMDIFTFYKELSNELNNNVTYSIKEISKPYYFVPVSEKDFEVDESNAVFNLNGVIIGNKIEEYKYEMLSSEQQDKVSRLIDIEINCGETDNEKEIKKIKKFAEDLYVGDKSEVDDRFARQMNNFELYNLSKTKNGILLSGQPKNDGKFSYLHLYDMGQKVKLESIENSLRLIKQGASGAAAEMLEYIIGDKVMPSNYSRRQMNDGKDKYIKGLDESQKKAFLMATDGSPVSLIKGPPGTGKTYVINAIVQYITKELKQKVVISSQTHVAIDNVLDEIMENYDLIIPNRITNRKNKYSGEEIDKTLYKTWGKKFLEHNARSTNSLLAKKIEKDILNFKGENKFKYSANMQVNEYSVIGATTTTSEIGGKKGLELLKGYDWLIIDEVSKCPITEVLRYLPYVNNIIMVGDDYQLAPLLEFTKEDVEGLKSYDEDKFEKLKRVYEDSVFAKTLQKAQKVGRLVTLSVNYRSVEKVLNAYNIFYNKELVNMREKVKPRNVDFDSDTALFNEKDIFFVDVKNGKETREGTSRLNVEEINATKNILEDLLKHTIHPEKVSVSAIFPYAAQINYFQKHNLELINRAKKAFKSFEIDTVDAFQGRETDVVLVNTVVTDSSQRNFLNDFRRINVSMSRARDKLFVFGNPTTLSRIEMQVADGNKRKYFSDIIDDIRRFGGWITYEGGIDYESSRKAKIKIV